jgi:hypothetical protein
MSQTQTVEAARVRIQRLVEEIAALSKGEMRSEEYYQQFLTRAVAACDAKGGAVWLVGPRSADGKSEFQLAGAVDLEASLFQTDEQQRSVLLRALSETVQSKKAFVLAADGGPAPEPGSIQAQLSQLQPQAQQQSATANRTPYPFVHVPLFLKEQVLGVVQIWLQPYVTRENYTEFATFLAQLATHVEQHFQSRRMGNMVVENQRLQHLLKFVSDLTGAMEPLEVARLASNYGRDLLACDRCAVLRLRGGKWETLSISGQEVVEKKGALVKGMTAFVGAHTPLEPLAVQHEGVAALELKPWLMALGKKELLALAENSPEISESRVLALRPHGPTDDIDALFFESSQVSSTLIVQVLDAEKRVLGALLAESTVDGFFEVPPNAKDSPGQRLAEWLANNTGRALRSALDHTDLPFLFATKRLREMKRNLTGSHRARYLLKLIFWVGLLVGVLLFPWMEEVESDCTLVPKLRAKVVPEINGRIESVAVREGTLVKKGDVLGKQDTNPLEAEIAHSREELLAASAEVQKYRSVNDPASEQIAYTKVRAAEERIKRLERDVGSATLRAPFDGVVMTKDIELMRGVYLNAGTDFAVIGTLDAWNLNVHIHEKQIGKIEKLMESKGSVDVRFILYSQNQVELTGQLKDRNQISQIAYPHERENAVRENAFIITLPDVQAPPEIRQGFRPELTGRSSIKLGRKPMIVIWARDIAQWARLKWVW